VSPVAPWRMALWLALLALGLAALGLSVGSGGWEPLGGWRASDDGAHTILWQIRWPGTLGAWLAGALLGLAGALAQGLFRNPLADPYLLGSASGAGLGVALFLSWLGGAALDAVDRDPAQRQGVGIDSREPEGQGGGERDGGGSPGRLRRPHCSGRRQLFSHHAGIRLETEWTAGTIAVNDWK